MIINFKSIIGVRPTNEDKHNIILNLNNNNKKAKVNLFSIFDGHGGKYVSKYMEHMLPKYLMHPKMKYPMQKKTCNSIFKVLQNDLITKHKKQALNTGSTCVAAVMYKEKNHVYMQVMNIGDSRFIMCKNGIAKQVTVDHKPTQPDERTRITQLGGKIIWDSNDYRIAGLSLSRAMGDISGAPYISQKPDVYTVHIDKHVQFVILCCDGLVESMSNQDAVDFIINKCYEPDKKTLKASRPKNIASLLANEAIKRGSTDNVSIIVIFF